MKNKTNIRSSFTKMKHQHVSVPYRNIILFRKVCKIKLNITKENFSFVLGNIRWPLLLMYSFNNLCLPTKILGDGFQENV